MSLRRELQHLQALNAELRKQIELLEKLLLEKEKPLLQVVGDRSFEQYPAVINDRPRFDSFRFRGFPVRCEGPCDYPNPWGGTTPPTCKKCGQPAAGGPYFTVTNAGPTKGSSQ